MFALRVLSLPGHRAIDRIACREVLNAAQEICGSIEIESLEIQSAAEAWKLHRLIDCTSNAATIVLDDSRSDVGIVERPLSRLFEQSSRPGSFFCAIGGQYSWLARDGLLNGRAAACSKSSYDQLKTHFPFVRWDPTRSCIRDGNFISSVGLFGGADGALALLRALDKEQVAQAVAARLGLQQASAPRPMVEFPLQSPPAHPALLRALAAINANDGTVWTSSHLARFACVSERHLQRLFRREFGCGVLEYLQKHRLKKALHLLRCEPGTSLSKVAELSGFTSTQQMRRLWRREYGHTPSAARFRSAPDSPAAQECALQANLRSDFPVPAALL